MKVDRLQSLPRQRSTADTILVHEDARCTPARFWAWEIWLLRGKTTRTIECFLGTGGGDFKESKKVSAWWTWRPIGPIHVSKRRFLKFKTWAKDNCHSLRFVLKPLTTVKCVQSSVFFVAVCVVAVYNNNPHQRKPNSETCMNSAYWFIPALILVLFI